MLNFFNTLPQTQPEYAFILLSKGGWSFSTFNLTSFIGTLITNSLLLAFNSKIGTWFRYNLVIAFCIFCLALCDLLCSTVMFSSNYPFVPYAIFFTFTVVLWNIAQNLMFITVVGRMSKYLPEGFESTGVTIIIAICNITVIVGGLITSSILDAYDVKRGFYERLAEPQIIVTSLSILLLFVSPALLWK